MLVHDELVQKRTQVYHQIAMTALGRGSSARDILDRCLAARTLCRLKVDSWAFTEPKTGEELASKLLWFPHKLKLNHFRYIREDQKVGPWHLREHTEHINYLFGKWIVQTMIIIRFRWVLSFVRCLIRLCWCFSRRYGCLNMLYGCLNRLYGCPNERTSSLRRRFGRQMLANLQAWRVVCHNRQNIVIIIRNSFWTTCSGL